MTLAQQKLIFILCLLVFIIGSFSFYRYGYLLKIFNSYYSDDKAVTRYTFCGREGLCSRGMARFITPPFWRQVNSFNDGLAAAEVNSGWGFIDETGSFVIKPVYDGVADFKDGYAVVRKGRKRGIINISGEIVIPLKYDLLDNFSEGLCLAMVAASREYLDGQYIYLDKVGNLAFSATFSRASSFSEGLAVVSPCNNGKVLGVDCIDNAGAFIPLKYGYINHHAKFVIPPEFSYAESFRNGFAAVKKNDKYGLIDKAGKEILPFQYDKLSLLAEYIEAVKEKETVKIFYDKLKKN